MTWVNKIHHSEAEIVQLSAEESLRIVIVILRTKIDIVLSMTDSKRDASDAKNRCPQHDRAK